jgi:tetratricopeptide (TPR) repeat protein
MQGSEAVEAEDLLARAAASLAEGALEDAEAAARAAVAAADDARGWEALAAVLTAGAQWEEAEAAIEAAAARAPDRGRLHVERARLLGRTGRTAAMLAALATALELEPDDDAPIHALAQALVNDADASPGVALRLAADLRSTAAPASALLLDLATLHLTSGRTPGLSSDGEAARAAVERLTAAGARLAAAERVGLAGALARAGAPGGAGMLLADLDPQSLPPNVRARAEHALAVVAAAAGRPDDAAVRFEAALAADPQRWQACCEGLQFLLASEVENATDHMRRLLTRVDDRVRRAHAPLLFNEALYHARVGRSAPARALLREVLARLSPEEPLARHAGEALAALEAASP